MFTWLHTLLGGSSPITGYFGSVIIILDVVKQVFADKGLPQDLPGWIAFGATLLTGLALRFAKYANYSNAPTPTDIPTTVR